MVGVVLVVAVLVVIVVVLLSVADLSATDYGIAAQCSLSVCGLISKLAKGAKIKKKMARLQIFAWGCGLTL